MKASGTYISGALLISSHISWAESTAPTTVVRAAGSGHTIQASERPSASTGDVPDWLIPSRVYDILKWLGLIVLPALALFVSTVGPAWDWTHVDAIVTTLNALGILAGALIGVSAIKQHLDLAA